MRMSTFRFIGRVLAFATMLAVVASCQQNPHPGIPADARLLDEAYGMKVYLAQDDTLCSPRRVSLYLSDNKTAVANKLLTTAGDKYVCNNETCPFKVAVGNIPTLADAEILSFEPLLLAAWGSADGVNIDTYILSESDSVICLPYVRFMGYSLHEDLLITESVAQYGFGGTYSILKVYDLQGHLVRTVPLNQQTDIPYEFYQEVLNHNDWNVKIEDLQRLVENNPGMSAEELIELAKGQ